MRFTSCPPLADTVHVLACSVPDGGERLPLAGPADTAQFRLGQIARTTSTCHQGAHTSPGPREVLRTLPGQLSQGVLRIVWTLDGHVPQKAWMPLSDGARPFPVRESGGHMVW